MMQLNQDDLKDLREAVELIQNRRKGKIAMTDDDLKSLRETISLLQSNDILYQRLMLKHDMILAEHESKLRKMFVLSERVVALEDKLLVLQGKIDSLTERARLQ